MFNVFARDTSGMFGGKEFLGEYETYEAALAKAKSFIDCDIEKVYQPGMTYEELCRHVFKLDIPIIDPEKQDEPFSATGYVMSRWLELTNS